MPTLQHPSIKLLEIATKNLTTLPALNSLLGC